MWKALWNFITDCVLRVRNEEGQPIPHSRRSKRRLRHRLNNPDRAPWQEFDQLRQRIGDTEGNTRTILKSIGAQPSRERPTNWGLRLPPVEHEQLRKRADLLSKQAGHPGRDTEFWNNAVEEFYQKGGKIYRRDGSKNIKEALGFTKDWVTSLIQLDTAAIGVIGAFISLKNFPQLLLSAFEWLPLLVAVLSFMVSIIAGIGILNALPGAIQRIPVNPEALRSDVFSIANEQRHLKLNTYSKLVRWSFVAGVISFVIFIGAQILQGEIHLVSGPIAPTPISASAENR